MGVVVIEPGLFCHYKSTEAAPKLYRVLFVAYWRGPEPAMDGVVHVVVGGLRHDASLSVEVHCTAEEDGDFPLFDARWSGNNTDVNIEPVVIYVALYDDGRVAARPLKEFEELLPQTDYDKAEPRFKRIGP